MSEHAAANDHFIVHRRDLTRCDFLTDTTTPPHSGEVLLRIEKFGLTSNNVTYAALGDALNYFKFFPVPEAERAGEWGCLPVWGIGQVIESDVPNLREGDRIYGFFPAATYLTMTPVASTTTGFRVERPGIPPDFDFYNQYYHAQLDPFYLPDQEDLMIVMRPLFLTGLLITDYLSVSDFGQDTVIISSAGSKTSYGLAAALHSAGRYPVLGLASARSKAFAESLQVYDRVFTYDDIAVIPQDLKAAYVDIAGSVPVRDQLASHLETGLKLVLSVGMTHWQDGIFGKPKASSEAQSKVFFAPGWIARRRKEAGAAFFSQLHTGWQAQMSGVGQHFQVVYKSGKTAVSQSFLDIAQGRSNPQEAHLLSL